MFLMMKVTSEIIYVGLYHILWTQINTSQTVSTQRSKGLKGFFSFFKLVSWTLVNKTVRILTVWRRIFHSFFWDVKNFELSSSRVKDSQLWKQITVGIKLIKILATFSFKTQTYATHHCVGTVVNKSILVIKMNIIIRIILWLKI